MDRDRQVRVGYVWKGWWDHGWENGKGTKGGSYARSGYKNVRGSWCGVCTDFSFSLRDIVRDLGSNKVGLR